jgi:hypothetical protein
VREEDFGGRDLWPPSIKNCIKFTNPSRKKEIGNRIYGVFGVFWETDSTIPAPSRTS